MNNLLLLPIISLPMLLTGCETLVVARPPSRSVAYVERDYDRRHDRHDRYDDRYDRRQDRRDVVVVSPRPAYRPQAEVRYYSDSRGRYFIRDGRRVYTNSGVRY